ncbi:MAG: glycosyltransferase [Comamonadaceae bacterium]|nr:glycosyltransferase [Comamonadaceae bacterium]
MFAAVFRTRFPEGSALADTPFIVFLLSALLPWFAFQEGLNRAASGIVGRREVVRKVHFPVQVFPLAAAMAAFVVHGLSYVVFLAVFALWRGGLSPNALGAVAVLLALQFAVTAGLGLLLAAFTVYLRDTLQVLGLLLAVMFYTAPILYPLTLVPAEFHGMVHLNPFTAFAEAYHGAVLAGTLAGTVGAARAHAVRRRRAGGRRLRILAAGTRFRGRAVGSHLHPSADSAHGLRFRRRRADHRQPAGPSRPKPYRADHAGGTRHVAALSAGSLRRLRRRLPVSAGGGFTTPGILYRDARTTGALLRDLAPDVALGMMHYASALVVLGARLARLRTRTVASYRGPFYEYMRRYERGFRRRLFLRAAVAGTALLADRVIVPSHGTAEELRRRFLTPAARTVTIPNGIDHAAVARTSGMPVPELNDLNGAEVPIICAVARLTPEKNLGLLLEAFRRVRAARPAVLAVLGDGPERANAGSADRRLGTGQFGTPARLSRQRLPLSAPCRSVRSYLRV